MSKRTSSGAGFHDEGGDIQPPKKVFSPPSENASKEVPMDCNNSKLFIYIKELLILRFVSDDIIVTSIGKKGSRDEMQDRHVVNEKISQQIPVCGMYCYRHSIPYIY